MLRLWYLLILSLFVIASAVRAQEGAPFYELKHPIQGDILGRNLLLFEDKERSLRIEDVLGMSDENFQRSEQSIPNFGFNQSTMWVRFYLKNPSQKPQRVILEYGYPSADQLDLYYTDKNGQLKTRLNGDRRPVFHREISYRLPSFSVLVPPGVHVYHLRLQTEGVSRVPLKIWTVSRFQDKRSNEMAFLAFLYGFLFVMMFYNIFVSIMTQTKGYILYVLFIAVSIIHHAGSQALYMTFMPSRLAIAFSNEVYVVATGLGIVFSSLFTISFLNLKRRMRSFNNLLMVNTALGVVVCFVTPFNYNLGAKISTLTALVVSLSILVASLISCMKKYRPAYFFMVAWLISIVGTMASNLAHSEVLGVNFFTTWGGFLGIAIEVVLLSLAMGDKMRLAVENSQRAIRELNENLELKVEEKTRDIRSILSSIKIGIFTIVTQDLLVDREYSSSLEEIMEQSNLAGQPALDLLFGKSSLSKNEISLVESTLLAAIGEDPLQFETNAHTLVHEIHIKDRQGSLRILEIDWSVMLDKKDLVEKILVTCRDVTDLRRYQATLKAQQKELDYIGELVANTPAKTEAFFQSTDRFLIENQRLMQSGPMFQAEALKILFVNMHTIKGAARSLGFRDLASMTHEIEQHLADMQRGKKTWDPQLLMQDHRQLQELVLTYKRINESKLGRGRQAIDVLQLKRSDFQDELALLDSLEQTSDVKVMRRSILQLRNRIMEKVYRSAESFFQEASEFLPQLASDLGKGVPVLHYQVDGILFATETIEALEGAFVHIFRNTMDHGIESPAERLQVGKSPQGKIDILAEEDAHGLILYVRDDGRGLAIPKIENTARQRGLIQPDQKLTVNQIAQLIFESGFSTRQEVGAISGRGVGMDAVRQFVESLGGQVSVQLYEDEASSDRNYIPFCLVLFLPRTSYRRLTLALGA